jgi:hypothetical protein
MSRVLNVSGDYRIKSQVSGNIILDPGASGTVTITGNLDVVGTQTNIESTTISLDANIVKINYDPNNIYSGSGIPSSGPIYGQGGIEVWRGSLNPAYFVFDEGVTHFQPSNSSNVTGTFVLTTSNTPGTTGQAGLSLATIVTPSNTNFAFDMQNATYVLTIANASGYESRVSANNDIPNLKYVQNYVSTAISTAAINAIFYPTSGNLAAATSSVQSLASSIVFQLSSVNAASITSGGLYVGNVNVNVNTITNTTANNLVLTSVSGKVQISAYLTFANQATTPSTNAGQSNLYSSATVGPGKTGIYFNSPNVANDELMSRSRAVALSILL